MDMSLDSWWARRDSACEYFPAMNSLHPTFPLIALSLIASLSCTEEKIRTYRVAEEDSSEAPPAMAPAAAPTPTAGEGKLRWDVPDGWQELEPGQFQTALYDLGEGVKVSVSSLPGDAGGEAANVNRWRRQIGLGPVEDVGGETLAVEDGVSSKWFDLRGDADGILAAIISLGGETWFFKLSAPTAGIDAKRDAFMSFLAGIHMGSKPAPAEEAPPSTEKPGIALSVPDGWVKSEGSSMRVASFRIPSEGVPDGDVSVIPLFGEAGSVLENVNRWRAQLKLPALPGEGDPALGRKAAGASGEMLITHMVSTDNLVDGGKKGAISTAILKAGETTWFFKLAGEAELVAGNREKFEDFVLSAKIP
jgi:hypothetical protein